MRPSSEVASLNVTSGRPSRRRLRKPALTSAASSALSPTSTSSPAARSRRSPSPATRGSGSSRATTTRRTPAVIRASTQGGVWPQWQHGSRLTCAMAPRAAFPARRSASVSPCGRPPGWVHPRPTTRPSFTITQPTAGFGQTEPSPRRASASAARIASSSRRRSPGGSALASIAIRRDPADEIAEILGLAEVPVDRGETDIGNLIEARQRLHDEASDHVARDIGLARTLQLPHQRVDNAFHSLRLERALAQRNVDRSGQLVSVEGFAVPIFLDHGQLAQLHPLESREAGAAIWAEPPASDRTAIVCRTRILYLGVIGSAKRTAHLLLRLVRLLRWAERRYSSRARPPRVTRRSGSGRTARERLCEHMPRPSRCLRVVSPVRAIPRRSIFRRSGTRPAQSRGLSPPASRDE